MKHLYLSAITIIVMRLIKVENIWGIKKEKEK